MSALGDKHPRPGVTVHYWNYRQDYRVHRKDYLRICDEVFSSGRLIMGERLAAFERKFAGFCGVPHAVGTASGTDALFLCLKALGIGAGDEVITVANTAVPTVAAIRAAGAMPVFVDVEEDTFLMDVSQIERVITGRTRCIMPVHLFGQMADMQPLRELADHYNIYVVEDSAQACGAVYQGQSAGSMSDAGAFSFYPTKVLGAFGDGGIITTSGQELHDRLRRLRFYGMESAYCAEEEGYNSRLDELQAALLDIKLDRLKESVSKRQRIADIYDKGLSGIGDIRTPAVRPKRSHQYYLYTIRTAYRDSLINYLSSRNIETKINYPAPVHLMQAYRFLGYDSGSLPVTEAHSDSMLSLPMYPELPAGHAEEVVSSVRRYFKLKT